MGRHFVGRAAGPPCQIRRGERWARPATPVAHAPIQREQFRGIERRGGKRIRFARWGFWPALASVRLAPVAGRRWWAELNAQWRHQGNNGGRCGPEKGRPGSKCRWPRAWCSSFWSASGRPPGGCEHCHPTLQLTALLCFFCGWVYNPTNRLNNLGARALVCVCGGIESNPQTTDRSDERRTKGAGRPAGLLVDRSTLTWPPCCRRRHRCSPMTGSCVYVCVFARACGCGCQ